jgi:hypothetical protein
VRRLRLPKASSSARFVRRYRLRESWHSRLRKLLVL